MKGTIYRVQLAIKAEQIEEGEVDRDDLALTLATDVAGATVINGIRFLVDAEVTTVGWIRED